MFESLLGSVLEPWFEWARVLRRSFSLAIVASGEGGAWGGQRTGPTERAECEATPPLSPLRMCRRVSNVGLCEPCEEALEPGPARSGSTGPWDHGTRNSRESGVDWVPEMEVYRRGLGGRALVVGCSISRIPPPPFFPTENNPAPPASTYSPKVLCRVPCHYHSIAYASSWHHLCSFSSRG